MGHFSDHECVSRTYFQNILDDMGYFLTIN